MMTTHLFPEKLLGCLKAPRGNNETTLIETEEGLKCSQTGEFFPHANNIPSLFAPAEWENSDVTQRVKEFYEENPFPSYEGLEDFSELVNKGYSNPFTNSLLKAIGYNKLILECGCGTGQISHFLQLNNNHVLGIDMSLTSLGLAQEHKIRNELARVAFAQMNIFELAIKDESFDVVISHGVLHHTFDAALAFDFLVKKAKSNGIVIVGLYNKPARLPTLVRSKLIGLFGSKIDYVVRNRIQDEKKAQIWVNDQYYNPHETWHSIDEVFGWFDNNNIEILNVSPPVLGSSTEDSPNLFEKSDLGSPLKRWTTQISWLSSIAREGAVFDVIGRKRI